MILFYFIFEFSKSLLLKNKKLAVPVGEQWRRLHREDGAAHHFSTESNRVRTRLRRHLRLS